MNPSLANPTVNAKHSLYCSLLADPTILILTLQLILDTVLDYDNEEHHGNMIAYSRQHPHASQSQVDRADMTLLADASEQLQRMKDLEQQSHARMEALEVLCCGATCYCTQ